MLVFLEISSWLGFFGAQSAPSAGGNLAHDRRQQSPARTLARIFLIQLLKIRLDALCHLSLSLVTFQHGGRRAAMLFDGNEFKIVVIKIEKASRSTIDKRNGHPTFAGRQAMIAKRNGAIQFRQLRQENSYRAASPYGKYRKVGP